MKRCVFFDRDGVVNRSPGPGYVERVEDFHLLPGVVEAARMAQARGYAVAIATNQRGVARGLMTPQVLDDIHAHMTGLLARQGLELLGVFCCTHERDTCTCRKPQPGLLLEAARQFDLDLSASWMIGDHETDIEAGRRAGCRTILVHPVPVQTRATLTVERVELLASVLGQVLDDIRCE